MLRQVTLLLLLCWSVCSIGPSASGSSILVILSKSGQDQKTFSNFFSSLTDRGFTLDFKQTGDEIRLVKYGRKYYDHLIQFAPAAEVSDGHPNAAKLMEFLDLGGNILFAASSKISNLIRDFAFEFSVDFDDSETNLVDPFHKVEDLDDTIYSDEFVGNDYTLLPRDNSLKRQDLRPIAFRGISHRLTGRNPLITPLILALPSSYSFPVANDESVINQQSPFIGHQNCLVSALQARNNARVVFSGSVDMFSDKFFKVNVQGKKSGNAMFANEISKWVLQEKGVLKAATPFHHRQNETDQHGIYRIEDQMVYEVSIKEFHSGKWNPFLPKDAQFEAIMLDPYLRQTMTIKNGSLRADFKFPDVYGVFTLRLKYERHGLSWVETSETVQVRPYRHDQYPRFLVVAYPYYVNAFSMMVSFVLLSSIWLFFRESGVSAKKSTKEKKQ